MRGPSGPVISRTSRLVGRGAGCLNRLPAHQYFFGADAPRRAGPRRYLTFAQVSRDRPGGQIKLPTGNGMANLATAPSPTKAHDRDAGFFLMRGPSGPVVSRTSRLVGTGAGCLNRLPAHQDFWAALRTKILRCMHDIIWQLYWRAGVMGSIIQPAARSFRPRALPSTAGSERAVTPGPSNERSVKPWSTVRGRSTVSANLAKTLRNRPCAGISRCSCTRRTCGLCPSASWYSCSGASRPIKLR
jgi:hypothetical protein